MIVVTVFEQNGNSIWFKNCHHDHIPFTVKGNGNIVFSVYRPTSNGLLIALFPPLISYWINNRSRLFSAGKCVIDASVPLPLTSFSPHLPFTSLSFFFFPFPPFSALFLPSPLFTSIPLPSLALPSPSFQSDFTWWRTIHVSRRNV